LHIATFDYGELLNTTLQTSQPRGGQRRRGRFGLNSVMDLVSGWRHCGASGATTAGDSVCLLGGPCYLEPLIVVV